MGVWAIASLLSLGIIWTKGEANPLVVRSNKNTLNKYLFQLDKYGHYHLPQDILQAHSASVHQPQILKYTNTNFPLRTVRYNHGDPIDNASPIYESFDQTFERNLENQLKTAQSISAQAANDRSGTAEEEYDDHKTSQTTNILGPHQIETIYSDHHHKEVPAYDISSFQHYENEKHGEVHYHQHKHIHKHEHKQEHVHQHKQEHQHKHLHHQQHKHDHQSQHGHHHEHKHNHHQEHSHHHNQHHKHDHHHKHNHGHKHQHHNDHKHNHGHKHHHSKY